MLPHVILVENLRGGCCHEAPSQIRRLAPWEVPGKLGTLLVPVTEGVTVTCSVRKESGLHSAAETNVTRSEAHVSQLKNKALLRVYMYAWVYSKYISVGSFSGEERDRNKTWREGETKSEGPLL
jgi:hypothetical protein